MVVENHAVLVEAIEAEIGRTVPAIEAAISDLDERLTTVADCELALRELGDDGGEWLTGRAVSFYPGREGRLAERDALDADVRGLLDGILAKVNKPAYSRASF